MQIELNKGHNELRECNIIDSDIAVQGHYVILDMHKPNKHRIQYNQYLLD